MNTKLTNIGLISGLAGTVILGVGAIVAECRRHKTKKKLIDRELELCVEKVDNFLMRGQIRILEEELEKSKS